jgi:hypothetical protein
MPKKKPTKHKRSKKKTAAGGAAMPTLTEKLNKQVKDALRDWQLNDGKDAIRSKVMDMMNPSKFDTSLLLQMIARTQTFNSLLSTAKTNGELPPWVMPLTAAIAFEALFHTCAAFWLASGDPPAPGTLAQSVEDFVDMQVSNFASCIGAA